MSFVYQTLKTVFFLLLALRVFAKQSPTSLVKTEDKATQHQRDPTDESRSLPRNYKPSLQKEKPKSCTDRLGKRRKLWESWKVDCNTCICFGFGNGKALCTEKSCQKKEKSCTDWSGKRREVGERWALKSDCKGQQSCTCEDGGSVNCLHDMKGCPRPFPSRLPSDNCTLIQQLYKACVDVNWKERICKRFIRLSFWFARKTKCLTDEEITILKRKKRKTICRDPSGQRRKTGDTWTRKQFCCTCEDGGLINCSEPRWLELSGNCPEKKS